MSAFTLSEMSSLTLSETKMDETKMDTSNTDETKMDKSETDKVKIDETKNHYSSYPRSPGGKFFYGEKMDMVIVRSSEKDFIVHLDILNDMSQHLVKMIKVVKTDNDSEIDFLLDLSEYNPKYVNALIMMAYYKWEDIRKDFLGDSEFFKFIHSLQFEENYYDGSMTSFDPINIRDVINVLKEAEWARGRHLDECMLSLSLVKSYNEDSDFQQKFVDCIENISNNKKRILECVIAGLNVPDFQRDVINHSESEIQLRDIMYCNPDSKLVKIIFAEQDYYMYDSLLFSMSSVIKAMFSNGKFEESKTRVIDFSGYDMKAVLYVFKVEIFQSTFDFDTERNGMMLAKMFVFADMYNIEDAKNRFEKCLISEINMNNCFDIIRICSGYEKIIDACLLYIKTHPTQCKSKLPELSKEMLIRLITTKDNCKCVNTESIEDNECEEEEMDEEEYDEEDNDEYED